jgi:hypothetical protein
MLLSLFMGLASRLRSRTVGGLAYGRETRQTAEVHAPVGADGEAPVVVVLRPPSAGLSEARFLGRLLAARGLVAVVAAVGARSDALSDAAAACAWAGDRSAEFGGDPRRLFAFGAAEGAGVAARLALETRWLAEAGAGRLGGVVGFLGRYDLCGVEAAALARPDAPPLLLVGGRDRRSEADLGAGRLIGALPLGLIALDEVERFIRLGSLEPAV